MPANANQEQVTIHRNFVMQDGHYSTYDKNSMWTAAKYLNSGVGFVLWLYFAGNADHYVTDIYPADVVAKFGMDRSSYYNARKDLVDFGYLIKNPEDSYGYDFYAVSEVDKQLLAYLPKARTKRGKIEHEKELVNKYQELVDSDKKYSDYTIDDLWLYSRGQTYKWEVKNE